MSVNKMSFLLKIIRYFIGVSFGSERKILVASVIASIALVIGSGITTYEGVHQFSTEVVALLITVGIQGLLFASSWRIGYAYISNQLTVLLMIIFIITLLSSVFFSFASLFKNVYSENEKKQNRDVQSRVFVSKIFAELESKIIKIDNTMEKMPLFNKWEMEFMNNINKYRSYLKDDIVKIKNKQSYLESESEREKEKGGTKYTDEQGKTRTTIAGEGPKYREFKQLELENKEKLISAEDLYKRFDELLNGIYMDVSLFKETRNISSLHSINNKCYKLMNDVGSEICRSSLLTDFINAVGKMPVLTDDCIKENVSKMPYSDIIANARSCINAINVAPETKQIYHEEIGAFEKEEGNEVHYYVTVYNEIVRKNKLAVGALILATVIDLLVLFASLLGVRHESFLAMNKPQELDAVMDNVAELLLTASTEENSQDSPQIRRIKLILRNSRYDYKKAKEGCAVVIDNDIVEQLGMQKEVGAFLARGYMVQYDGFIGIRTRMVIWMSEKIVKESESNDLLSDIGALLKNEGDGNEYR